MTSAGDTAVATAVPGGTNTDEASVEPLRLQAPPQVMRPIPQPLIVRMMPLLMLLAAGGMVAVMFSAGAARNPVTLMFPAMMALSTVAMLVSSWQGGNRRVEMAEKRRDYLRYLDLTRVDLQAVAQRQREELDRWYPDPATLRTRCAAGQALERLGADIAVRAGTGTVDVDLPIIAPEPGSVEDLEPVSVLALRRLVRSHTYIRDAPIAIALAEYPIISCYGDACRVRAFYRAIIAQLVTRSGPQEVRVAAVCGDRHARLAWDELKWLPHHLHELYADGAGAVRLTESSFARMEYLLGAPPGADGPHVVLIADGQPQSGKRWLRAEAIPSGCTVLEVCSAPSGEYRSAALRSGLALDLDLDGQISASNAENSAAAQILHADALDGPTAATLFRDIARQDAGGGPWVGDTRSGSSRAEDHLSVLGHPPSSALRNRPPGTWDAASVWQHRDGAARLRVPIGRDDAGELLHLDLKEPAHGGHGPHGLCVGATGSGKSEFLRTLVLGLLTTHSPEQLNVVLVDFKGGATFRGLARMHHVAASITNLAEEEALVDRMRDALEGELVRRQETLRVSGQPNVAEYEKARRNGLDGPPLPALFIVVDEFSELLSARPELIDLFVQIGRLGRSLHIHLLLASQRLEEGRLRGLESHLSYRIALKTFSAAESRVVLGSTEAYTLPGRPGSAYLKVDAAAPVRFDAAYVSGPLRAAVAEVATEQSFVAVAPTLREFDCRYLPVPAPAHREAPTAGVPDSPFPADISSWELCIQQLSGVGQHAHRIWLAPLGDYLPLGRYGLGVVSTQADVSDGGATDRTAPDSATRTETAVTVRTAREIPWALVDRPFEQRHDLLTVDFHSPAANALVVGAPRSGKSFALLTLALSAAARYSPDELHIYGIDYGGGELGVLADLPHTAGIAHRGDCEKTRRVLAEVISVMRRREQEQRRNRSGQIPTVSPTWPRVLLLVDGWAAIRTEIEDLDTQLATLAGEGLGYGIHVCVAAARLMDVRPAVRDALALRLELRLVDPADSMLGRRGARSISPRTPGRGVIDSGHLVQVLAPDVRLAVPTVDAVDKEGRGVEDAVAGPATQQALSAMPTSQSQEVTRHSVAEIARVWQHNAPGVRAPQIRLLPERLRFADIAGLLRIGAATGKTHRELRLPVGLDEAELAPAYLDLAADPLALVFGDAGSGKTSLLRCVARGLVALAPAAELRILLVDYRRSLRGVVPPEHLAGIAATEEELAPMVTQLADVMRARLAAEENSSPAGPRIVVLVDDVDLVIGAGGNPLSPLVPLLAHADQIGLSLLLTRRVSGAARAAFDPVMQRMRDLGAVGLVLDGSKDEGRLIGDLVARPAPPGRAQFYSRRAGTRLWQLALLEEHKADGTAAGRLR